MHSSSGGRKEWTGTGRRQMEKVLEGCEDEEDLFRAGPSEETRAQASSVQEH